MNNRNVSGGFLPKKEKVEPTDDEKVRSMVQNAKAVFEAFPLLFPHLGRTKRVMLLLAGPSSTTDSGSYKAETPKLPASLFVEIGTLPMVRSDRVRRSPLLNGLYIEAANDPQNRESVLKFADSNLIMLKSAGDILLAIQPGCLQQFEMIDKTSCYLRHVASLWMGGMIFRLPVSPQIVAAQIVFNALRMFHEDITLGDAGRFYNFIKQLMRHCPGLEDAFVTPRGTTLREMLSFKWYFVKRSVLRAMTNASSTEVVAKFFKRPDIGLPKEGIARRLEYEIRALDEMTERTIMDLSDGSLSNEEEEMEEEREGEEEIQQLPSTSFPQQRVSQQNRFNPIRQTSSTSSPGEETKRRSSIGRVSTTQGTITSQHSPLFPQQTSHVRMNIRPLLTVGSILEMQRGHEMETPYSRPQHSSNQSIRSPSIVSRIPSGYDSRHLTQYSNLNPRSNFVGERRGQNEQRNDVQLSQQTIQQRNVVLPPNSNGMERKRGVDCGVSQQIGQSPLSLVRNAPIEQPPVQIGQSPLSLVRNAPIEQPPMVVTQEVNTTGDGKRKRTVNVENGERRNEEEGNRPMAPLAKRRKSRRSFETDSRGRNTPLAILDTTEANNLMGAFMTYDEVIDVREEKKQKEEEEKKRREDEERRRREEREAEERAAYEKEEEERKKREEEKEKEKGQRLVQVIEKEEIPSEEMKDSRSCEICEANIEGDQDRYRRHIECGHDEMIGTYGCHHCHIQCLTMEGRERHILFSHSIVTHQWIEKERKGKDNGVCRLCQMIVCCGGLIAHLKNVHKTTLENEWEVKEEEDALEKENGEVMEENEEREERGQIVTIALESSDEEEDEEKEEMEDEIVLESDYEEEGMEEEEIILLDDEDEKRKEGGAEVQMEDVKTELEEETGNEKEKEEDCRDMMVEESEGDKEDVKKETEANGTENVSECIVENGGLLTPVDSPIPSEVTEDQNVTLVSVDAVAWEEEEEKGEEEEEEDGRRRPYPGQMREEDQSTHSTQESLLNDEPSLLIHSIQGEDTVVQGELKKRSAQLVIPADIQDSVEEIGKEETAMNIDEGDEKNEGEVIPMKEIEESHGLKKETLSQPVEDKEGKREDDSMQVDSEDREESPRTHLNIVASTRLGVPLTKEEVKSRVSASSAASRLIESSIYAPALARAISLQDEDIKEEKEECIIDDTIECHEEPPPLEIVLNEDDMRQDNEKEEDERPPMTFSHVHGENVVLKKNASCAIRTGSFCKAVVFSSRTINDEEMMYLKVPKGALRMGLTSVDPHSDKESMQCLPYLVPSHDEKGKIVRFRVTLSSEELNEGEGRVKIWTEGHFMKAQVKGRQEKIIYTSVDSSIPQWLVLDVVENVDGVNIEPKMVWIMGDIATSLTELRHLNEERKHQTSVENTVDETSTVASSNECLTEEMKEDEGMEVNVNTQEDIQEAKECPVKSFIRHPFLFGPGSGSSFERLPSPIVQKEEEMEIESTLQSTAREELAQLKNENVKKVEETDENDMNSLHSPSILFSNSDL